MTTIPNPYFTFKNHIQKIFKLTVNYHDILKLSDEEWKRDQFHIKEHYQLIYSEELALYNHKTGNTAPRSPLNPYNEFIRQKSQAYSNIDLEYGIKRAQEQWSNLNEQEKIALQTRYYEKAAVFKEQMQKWENDCKNIKQKRPQIPNSVFVQFFTKRLIQQKKQFSQTLNDWRNLPQKIKLDMEINYTLQKINYKQERDNWAKEHNLDIKVPKKTQKNIKKINQNASLEAEQPEREIIPNNTLPIIQNLEDRNYVIPEQPQREIISNNTLLEERSNVITHQSLNPAILNHQQRVEGIVEDIPQSSNHKPIFIKIQKITIPNGSQRVVQAPITRFKYEPKRQEGSKRRSLRLGPVSLLSLAGQSKSKHKYEPRCQICNQLVSMQQHYKLASTNCYDRSCALKMLKENNGNCFICNPKSQTISFAPQRNE